MTPGSMPQIFTTAILTAVLVLGVVAYTPAPAAAENASQDDVDPDAPIREDRPCVAIVVGQDALVDAMTAAQITSVAPSRMYLTGNTRDDAKDLARDIIHDGIEVVAIVGGENVVSDVVYDQLANRALLQVQRASGPTRVETARAAGNLAHEMAAGDWFYFNKYCREWNTS